MRIVLIKTSALGDVVHCLPALHAARAHLPASSWHWLARPAYHSLLALHPGVDKVLPPPSWAGRKKALQCNESQAPSACEYDLLIDSQGLMRSALWSRAYRARRRSGYSWGSAREPIASCFYGRRYVVERARHAVWRNFNLLAQALDLDLTASAGYGFQARTQPGGKRLALMVNASNASKLWEESAWQGLIASATRAGYQLWLPWHSDAERERCRRLAQAAPELCALPEQRLDLAQLVDELRACHGLIGLDTGVSHLAAALGLPVLALYFSTAPELSGVWSKTALNLSLTGSKLIANHQRLRTRAPAAAAYDGNLHIQRMPKLAPGQVWEFYCELVDGTR